MNDFNGSVAQQDVVITTEIVKTAVVGENFYKGVLYVTDRFKSDTDNPSPLVVTKDTYEDILNASSYLEDDDKTLVLANLAALFSYGATLTVYIVKPSDVPEYKFYGYFTYLDLKWTPTTSESAGEIDGADYKLEETGGKSVLEAMKTFDKEFTFLLSDLPVDPTKMRGTDAESTKSTVKQVSSAGIDLALFVRPARPSGDAEASTDNAYLDAEKKAVGPSPALYQLGRTLSKFNESGVPVGNAFDMDAVSFANVLPTADTDLDVVAGAGTVLANYFANSNINYFKLVGNGTMNITNFGGWTIFKNCIGAEWIVAYLNFMNRVSCATIITNGGRSLKNVKTYETILSALKANISGQVENGRIEQFKLTAPSFGELPKSDGHTIIIPDAWTGVYVDNVRKVQISGTLTVAA